MVEVKSLQIFDRSFIGLYLHLPGYPMYMIMSTKTILAQNMLDIHYFRKELPVSVIICEYHYGFQAMLNAKVIAMNDAAEAHGVTLEMKGKEALRLCENRSS